jgi:endonuclease G
MYQALLALVLLLTPATAAVAGSAPCPEHFAGGQAPILTNPKLAAQSRGLCFRAFAVLHSGLTRTPLWSAEHLTRQSVEAARELGRVNTFHAEDLLPPGQRAELSDYARSGFDRGHMSPSGDMPDDTAQEESFSLSNMVPQAPTLNRGIWEGIESAVRDLARKDGDLYVVTGPIFQGSSLQVLKERVYVPTDTFKAVYDPHESWAGAYVCTNTDEPTCSTMSLAQLQALSGIDIFPDLSEPIKVTEGPLPEPTHHGYAGKPRHHRSRQF